MHKLDKSNQSSERKWKRRSDFEHTVWLQVVLQLFFFTVGTDPFLIYKTDEGRKLANQDGKPTICQERLDRLREVWRVAVALVCVPIGAHVSIIGVVHLLNAIWMSGASSGRERGDESARKSFERAEEWFEQWSANLGDPLTRAPQLASIIYLGLSFATIILLVAFPMHLKESPLDSSSVRFLMRPEIEMEHLEGQATRQLLSIEMSFKFVDGSMFDVTGEEKRMWMPLSSPAERYKSHRLENQLWLVHEAQTDARQLDKLNLPGYTAASHKRLADFCKILMYLLMVGLVFIVVVSAALLLLFANDMHQPLKQLTFIEIIVMLTLSAVGISGASCGFLFQAYQQLGWIEDAAKELKNLLGQLRDRMSAVGDEHSEKLADLKLLRLLVHLNIFGQLARRSTRTQTTMVSLLVLVFLTSQTSGLNSRMLLEPDPTSDFQLFLMGCIWAYTNLLLLIASAMPSREIKMKKIAWSILAEQARASEQTKGCFLEDTSPFYELWRKLVLSQEFTSNNHPVRALGIRLTFKTVLQANFLLLSIISWLQTRS